MGVAYNAAIAKPGALGLILDAANSKSFSPNVFSNALDIYAWASAAGTNQCTISRDNNTPKSPAGGIPMLMATANPGTAAYIGTYNNSTWNIANATVGQTWTVSFWVKGSSSFTGSLLLFEANSSSVYTTYGQVYYNVTTQWTRVTYSYTITQATTAYIQTRFDCYNNSVNMWVDGLQIELSSSATTFNPRYNPNRSNWLDMSLNKCNGTMYGVVPLSTDVAPCFDFGGVTGAAASSASLGFSFASNPVTLTGGFTFSTWIKNPPSNSGQVGLFSNAGGAEGYRFGVGRNGCYVLIGGNGNVGYSEPTIAFASTLDANLWYNVAMVFDRTGANSGGTPQWQLYLNGEYQTAANMNTPQNVSMPTSIPGMVRSACCGLYTGKLAQFMVHNTPLSGAEIRQNYNAYRARFGL